MLPRIRTIITSKTHRVNVLLSPSNRTTKYAFAQQQYWNHRKVHNSFMNKRHFEANPVISMPSQIPSTQYQHETIAIHPTHTYDKESITYCYDTLEKVSRSFAMVIQQLPENIRDSICIFYLILRGLDSIEDDMQNFQKLSEKVNLLDNFHKILDKTSYSLKGIGDKKQYQELLENFTKVLNVYHSLKSDDKIVIQNITKEMAYGMKQFVIKQYKETENEENVNTRVKSLSDYNEYCYYVAGIIGNGLSEIFSKSGLEDKDFYIKNDESAINMGLFLQKTNITRDYLEDINEGRIFWPNEILTNYVDSASYFKENPKSKTS